MTSDNLKGYIKKRTYKERSQVQERKKYGFLEKHKDYVVRARDYHQKERRIKKLREKAANRNEDEFYFRMQSSSTKDGVHVATSGKSKRTKEEMERYKKQDLSYFTSKAVTEQKKVGKLRAGLHSLGEAKGEHKIFVDSMKEAKAFDPAKHFDTVDELADRKFNRLKKSQLEDPKLVASLTEEKVKQMNAAKRKSYKELSLRQKREAGLKKTVAKLTMEKALLGKGRRQKISDGENGGPPVYKWKKERKR
uniref:U3 small nucleolar RNA-associated protein 11 n=1 Tax=Palpitomonas bilix TaxID=652834 RepID=A0A7S3GIG3_9EUKA|mmetsp:Transcript_516/g.1069  ORF Transcript_516/g.1069 Transcript_516/m.1069 type:complete len:250 (+) Transcript_516:321-1070(+)